MKKLIICLVFFLSLNSLYTQWELVPGWLHHAPRISYIVSYNDTIMAKIEGSLLISLDNGNSWDTVSIEDTYINVHKIINGKLVVGTKNGIYISSDMGNNWIPKNNGINFSINEISYENDKLYINAPGNGIFYSSDWGDNWAPIDIKGLPYSDIGLYDVNNNEIWALSMKEEKIGSITYYYGGLFTSTNLGENWVPVMNGNDTLQARYFARKGDSIFVIEYSSFLMYMSPDNGKNWNKVNVAGGNTNLYSMFLKDSVIFVSTLAVSMFQPIAARLGLPRVILCHIYLTILIMGNTFLQLMRIRIQYIHRLIWAQLGKRYIKVYHTQILLHYLQRME